MGRGPYRTGDQAQILQTGITTDHAKIHKVVPYLASAGLDKNIIMTDAVFDAPDIDPDHQAIEIVLAAINYCRRLKSGFLFAAIAGPKKARLFLPCGLFQQNILHWLRPQRCLKFLSETFSCIWSMRRISQIIYYDYSLICFSMAFMRPLRLVSPIFL